MVVHTCLAQLHLSPSPSPSVGAGLLPPASFAPQPVLPGNRRPFLSYRDPAELVRKAVQNEIKAANDDSAHFLFRGTKTTPQGSTTRLYVETKEATAGLVIAYNGKPLTPEQRREEEARVERFIKHPEELKKKREQEHAECRAHSAHHARTSGCLPV